MRNTESAEVGESAHVVTEIHMRQRAKESRGLPPAEVLDKRVVNGQTQYKVELTTKCEEQVGEKFSPIETVPGFDGWYSSDDLEFCADHMILTEFAGYKFILDATWVTLVPRE